MRWFCLGSSILMLAAFGCAGSRPRAEPLLEEFARYERDAEALQPASEAADILRVAQQERDQARALLRKNDQQACSLLLDALADVRSALSLAQADQAWTQATACLAAVDRSRRIWEEVLHRLIEAEQVARRTAEGVSHEVPGLDAARLPDLPPSTGEGSDPPAGSVADLSAAWEVWSDSARAHDISAADLQERFDSQLALAGNRAGSGALRRAGRTLQELEARVRRELSLSFCARAALLLTDLGAAQNAAQNGRLGLEYGLKEDLRAELEEERTRAGDVMSNVLQALQQVAGEEIAVSPEGTAVRVHLGERFFDPKKSGINRKAEFDLVRIVTVLNQYPGVSVAVEGREAEGGSARAAAAAKVRAQAVFDFLTAQGVPAQKMTIQGYSGGEAEGDTLSSKPPETAQGVDLLIAARP
jgi:outer membrane protein OmpA-like peptidoglycan-associated protein